MPTRQSFSTQDVTVAAQTWTAVAPIDVQVGDLLIACLDNQNHQRVISTATGWTFIHSFIAVTGPMISYRYYRIADGADPYAFVWDASTGSTGALTVMRYNGQHATEPINKEHISEVVVASQIRYTGTLTPTKDNCLILCTVAADAGSGATTPAYVPDSRWTEFYDYEGTTADVMVGGFESLQTRALGINCAIATAVEPIGSLIAIAPPDPVRNKSWGHGRRGGR